MSDSTPGPWLRETNFVYALDADGKCNRFSASLSGGFTSYDNRSQTTFDEQEANAHLISAAPDMFEALAALEPHLDAIICYASTMGEHEPNRLAANARAAIAKARGETL